MDRLHYYCLTFFDNHGGHTAYASTYYGFPEPHVTLRDIQTAKQGAEVSSTATLLACSYLGQMTAQEFKAGT
ncbi:hypothetical protein [Pseudomonas putida]|uniref:Uncharacterized protein n=1 Tax=Pseudomonas putida TaxID=303 RepID=A0A1Q9QUM0_PSEPU|nr:hypothetical protein [Pseudomonas putida]OLS58838.1 hypothetical protein PSEMO_61990 [Pseudomonas putida]